MPYNTSFGFDSVAVIESIPTGELQTGRDLFDSVLAPASTADPGFVSELYRVSSAKEFLGALENVRREAAQFHRSPIVHIETHGDKEGIALSNGDFVAWADIASIFTSINTLSRMNLLAVAAMCHGWHMVSLLRPVERAPAFGIVGTEEKVSAGDLLEAMQRFYRVLVGPARDLRKAMDEANLGVSYEGWRFKMEWAELWLCRAFKHYIETMTIRETLTQRVNRMVAEVARAQDLDVRGTMMARAALTAGISDHNSWFNYYKTRFLLLDLFPDNASRFPWQFEDCGKAEADKQR